MKKIFRSLMVLGILTSLTGCLDVKEQSFKLNAITGEGERFFGDIVSKKGPDETDYSLEKDCEGLNNMVKADADDSDVIKRNDFELIKGENQLSAKQNFKVACPNCFGTKSNLLEYLLNHDSYFSNNEKEFKIKNINDDIFLIFPKSLTIESTNGKKIETENNNVIIWPETQEQFEFILHKDTEGTAMDSCEDNKKTKE